MFISLRAALALIASGCILAAPVLAQTASGNASPRIANGVETFDFPSTVTLISPHNTPGGGFSFCTGTLIGCETVLTAAHCVCETDGGDCQQDGAALTPASQISVAMQNGKTLAVDSVHVPSDYQFGLAADIAVLKLSEPVSGISPTPINSSQFTSSGTPGTIVGYGTTVDNLTDNGIKRRGNVVASACVAAPPDPVPDSEHLCWEFSRPAATPGTHSNTCPGDSGGPLFIDFGNGPVVAGVTSGGIAPCHIEDIAFDTRVFANRAFVQSIAGADLNNTSCGSLPQVGQAGATVIPNSGDLSITAPERRHSFAVTADVSELRVVLNGTQQSGNDFDLYVKRGSQPTLNDYDCRPFLNGNFEACLFSNPVADTYHALIHRFAGSGGAYQLTTTTFSTTGDRTGVWYDPSRSGQGVQLLQEGNTLSGAWYFYDPSGQNAWVTFVGALNGNNMRAELLRFVGPALDATWNPSQVQFSSVGQVDISFSSNSQGIFSYTIDGVSDSFNLEPFDSASVLQSVTGVWYDPSRSGQGLQLVRNGNLLSGAWYHYNLSGQNSWVTFVGAFSGGNSVTADLLRFTGPALGTPFNPAQVSETVVGQTTLNFSSENTATFSYTIDGVSGVLDIVPF